MCNVICQNLRLMNIHEYEYQPIFMSNIFVFDKWNNFCLISLLLIYAEHRMYYG